MTPPNLRVTFNHLDALPRSAGTISGAALDAWRYCASGRLTLDQYHFQKLVKMIIICAPEQAAELPQHHVELGMRHGEIHFLDFWQVFRDASAAAGVHAEGLAAELELLRDRTLERLEFGVGIEAKLPAWTLIEELHRLAPASVRPKFWEEVMASISTQDRVSEMSLDQITQLFVSWIQESDRGSVFPSEMRKGGLQVRLHIYDCLRSEPLRALNNVFSYETSSLKLGGIFHAGVEVGGLEWSFDYQSDHSKPSVSCSLPKTLTQHRYRQTILLGRTELSEDHVADVISQLALEFPASEYDALHKNCYIFADELVSRLGLGAIPAWVHRFARVGAGVDSVAQNVRHSFNALVSPRSLQRSLQPTIDPESVHNDAEIASI